MIFLIEIKRFIKSQAKLQEIFLVSTFVFITISIIFIVGIISIKGFSKVLVTDSWYYYQMSFQPFKTTLAPYSYRILTPLMVYLLPINHRLGFLLIDVTALGSTAILFYYYLKKLNFNQLTSIIGALIFLLMPTTLYNTYDIALVDSLSFLFFLGAFYAILIRNDYLYLIIMVLGVINKETILLTLPLYFYCKLTDLGLKNALKSSLYILMPVIVIFIGLRYYYGFESFYSASTIKQVFFYHLNSVNILNNPYLAFGTLWIIFAYTLRCIKSNFLKKSLIVFPFVFLQLLIATDSFRTLFIAFPIVIPISLYIFDTRKKVPIFILIFISAVLVSLYSIFSLQKEHLFSFVVLPIEILILILLISYYFYLKQKNNLDNI